MAAKDREHVLAFTVITSADADAAATSKAGGSSVKFFGEEALMGLLLWKLCSIGVHFHREFPLHAELVSPFLVVRVF